ncbi:uncharacterized protein Z519_03857 [Cladophialophora bantiana CBS 173.52]|uniref:Beta-lactamase-related domain-containing protein n=1 Tax=Cladophialophora bantiana (strain ATCC 10958 / CBS 173.52 / CDC B-1940 / NIH 8579) TaxID=1442370 RepID=A0A0D2HPE9_CLAB1|nr:uncharacterized protein Z519_03857 [Cladophialophora bantiana CBS 173.52]KIW95273.1 hypothetical protein Z519_03857 [Cladophialophora bantiana CBS 173.52]
MGTRFTTAILLTAINFITPICTTCSSQSPAFPPPSYSGSHPELFETFEQIEESLASLFANRSDLNTSSYSVEVTSPHSTLWSAFHTAVEKDPERPGAEQVDGSSVYRIASITKVYTVLGILQQHAAGNLSLDDTVDEYITVLKTLRYRSGGTHNIPWGDITLRSLASQLSGIPRDWAQGDLITALPDPSVVGLPPLPPSAPERSDLPKCDEYGKYMPCKARDLLDYLLDKPPVFTPNQKSTYSNIAFELLGLVLANVTGENYEDYIESSILRPLNMTSTSFQKPSDSVAVLPKGNAWYWDVDEGVQNPTGGLYCPASDMSVFLRHLLKTYSNIANAKVNWLLPVSFTPGWKSFYGMPWEIYRTDRILGSSSGRTVSFFTKGGGLPGYRTLILLVPEYDLGITIFTAGEETFIDQVMDIVTTSLIRGADVLAARQVAHKYTGTFLAAGPGPGSRAINSSLQLSYSDTHGLEVTKWISNGTDMLSAIPSQFHFPKDRRFHAQLIPTALYRDPERKRGELWRITFTFDRLGGDVDDYDYGDDNDSDTILDRGPSRSGSSSSSAPGVWADFCVSDVDTMMYAGKPLSEIVFWDPDITTGPDDEGGTEEETLGARYGMVEMTAFRINMTRRHSVGGSVVGGDCCGEGGVGGSGSVSEKNVLHHGRDRDHDHEKLLVQDKTRTRQA